MTPYRVPPASPLAPRDEERREDRIVAGVVLAVGAVPVVVAMLVGRGFGGEATLGLILAVAGLLGVVRGTDVRATRAMARCRAAGTRRRAR